MFAIRPSWKTDGLLTWHTGGRGHLGSMKQIGVHKYMAGLAELQRFQISDCVFVCYSRSVWCRSRKTFTVQKQGVYFNYDNYIVILCGLQFIKATLTHFLLFRVFIGSGLFGPPWFVLTKQQENNSISKEVLYEHIINIKSTVSCMNYIVFVCTSSVRTKDMHNKSLLLEIKKSN